VEFEAKVIQGWINEIIGKVLITRSKLSFLGDIDINTGEIVGSDIDIKGKNVKNKILIFPGSRGSTVGSNVLYGLSRKGLAPKLIATCSAEPITISGAIFGEVPMISNLSENVFDHFKNNDLGRVKIIEGKAYIKQITKDK
jgi:hypothetical protein